jgi:hypothetical protein
MNLEGGQIGKKRIDFALLAILTELGMPGRLVEA